MKFDFTYYNPTKIYFGRTAIDNLAPELEKYGENVLLVYGKASIKKIGLYDKVMEILSDCGKKVVELSGIKSNPTYAQMMEGARLVRENNVDLILAVGGGSVIDCSREFQYQHIVMVIHGNAIGSMVNRLTIELFPLQVF